MDPTMDTPCHKYPRPKDPNYQLLGYVYVDDGKFKCQWSKVLGLPQPIDKFSTNGPTILADRVAWKRGSLAHTQGPAHSRVEDLLLSPIIPCRWRSLFRDLINVVAVVIFFFSFVKIIHWCLFSRLWMEGTGWKCMHCIIWLDLQRDL